MELQVELAIAPKENKERSLFQNCVSLAVFRPSQTRKGEFGKIDWARSRSHKSPIISPIIFDVCSFLLLQDNDRCWQDKLENDFELATNDAFSILAIEDFADPVAVIPAINSPSATILTILSIV